MQQNDNSTITISLSDIYHAQQETVIALAEIKGALALLSQQDRNDRAALADHESRIRKVEAKVYALPGVATIIALGGLAYTVLGSP